MLHTLVRSLISCNSSGTAVLVECVKIQIHTNGRFSILLAQLNLKTYSLACLSCLLIFILLEMLQCSHKLWSLTLHTVGSNIVVSK